MNAAKSGPIATVIDLANAIDAIQQNPGRFGDAADPATMDILHICEWFVDEGFALLLVADHDGGKVNPAHDCFSDGTRLQFHGVIFDLSGTKPERVGTVRWDVSPSAAVPTAHLDLWVRHGTQSMRRHLRRTYECLVDVGIKELTLEAGLDDGATFWAHAGVDFRAGQDLLDHCRALAAKLSYRPLSTVPQFASPGDVLRYRTSRKCSITTAYGVSEALPTPHGTPFVVKGQLDWKEHRLGIRVHDKIPVGQAILNALGPWDGRVDLSKPGDTDRRFMQFLGL